MRTLILPMMLGLIAPVTAQPLDTLKISEITPNVLVIATSAGNVVTSIGPDGALLVGIPSVESTEPMNAMLAARTKSPARYVVVFPEDVAHSEGDAGWGHRGAFVAMQENALGRLGGHIMGPPNPLPPRLKQLGADRPRISFSEVLSFDLNGEAIHVVHQPAGYSDADAIAHFHLASTVYLGEVFPGDGYPKIDAEQGGKLDGLLKTLGAWTSPNFHVVPARGSVAKGSDVRAFRDMIVAVRDRIKRLADAGRTEDQIVSEHPTADFDAAWGHGRVSPDAFVHEIYNAVRMQ